MRKLQTFELERRTIEEFKELDKAPFVFVLDNIRSANNVGSIFRTADGFASSAIYLCGITAKPPSKEIHKTALGATESVEWKYFEDTAAAVEKLHEDGYKVISVEQATDSVSIFDFEVKPTEKYAIVIAAGIAKWIFKGDTLLHVVQNDLNLKSEKKADAEVIATLNYGETVRVLDDEFWSPNRGVWLNVRTQYGEDGFVISNFLMDTKNFEITNSILANREARFQTDIVEKLALLQLFKKNKWVRQNQAIWRLKVNPESNIYNTISKIDLNRDSIGDFAYPFVFLEELK